MTEHENRAYNMNNGAKAKLERLQMLPNGADIQIHWNNFKEKWGTFKTS